MSTADAFKAEGNKALTEKRYDEAITAYTKAIELSPNDHVFYSNRSAAYLSKGDAEAALSDGEMCVKLNPSFAKGHGRIGAAYHKMGMYAEAVNTYESGLTVCPDDASLKASLAEVTKLRDQQQQGGGGGGGMGGLFGPQMLAKLAGHPKFGPKLADPTFQMKLQMMRTNPNMMMQDPEMMEVLTAILSANGMGMSEDDDDQPRSRPSGAPTPPASSSSSSAAPKPMDVAEDDSSLTPEEKEAKVVKARAVALKEKGNALYKEKKFDEAIAAYDEAVAMDPSNVMFLNNKAAVFIEQGNTAGAIEICQKALELAKEYRASYEDRAKIYQRIAAAHTKQGDVPAALAAFGKAQMEHFDKAVERKMKNLELEHKKTELERYINPELGLAAKERGNAFFREAKYPEAIAEYEEAVKRDPKNAPFRNNLAAAYLKMGLFNDAKREVEKSLDLDKTYVKAWAKKGDIEVYMKEYHKAMDSYKAGMQIEPDNSLCKAGLQSVMTKIYNEQSSDSADSAERRAHAMADPEIQAILASAEIQQLLKDMQENPAYAQKAMRDPGVAAKVNRLVAAGILKVA
jgi:stress-induced-phosphoprotein 1